MVKGAFSMARIQVTAQFACVLLLLAIPASAQRPRGPGPGPGPGGPGGNSLFFDAMREVFQETPNKELFDLVNHAKIRDEIALSAEYTEQLRDNMHAAMKQVFALRHDSDDLDPKLGKEDIKAKLREAIRPHDDASYKMLEMNSNFDRLLGIYAQARNNRAILIDPVAKKVGIEGAALEQFRKTRTEEGRKLWLETRDAVDRVMRNAPLGVNPRAEIEKLFKQAEEKLDRKLGELLTDEQHAKLEELKGVKFDDLPVLDRPPRRPGERNGPPGGEKRREPEEKQHDGNSTETKCADRGNEQLVCR